ncbi:putative methyltransferase, YaeB/AF_0241 family [Thioflavicoccus mobilis 8321]|uniref:Putative methyltransferase, YaeB/AF_0241 family n=1 Tax=Thioflavicoccus mobilis 8321 TaxID=765912 RepID=L0GYX5_9GAMM|nr:tRNA (N6-threonylcarbamoyladenosine(37)-N6)-methyltransferase TrmO [Thioflavicoccus mobilis]AGA91171.1 putative methyltransferase, YaeB/AF_0241 family [Thioflavicoccus mobilis 8321]
MDPIAFTPIGVVRSCFTDKFGIPRQANLVPAARARLVLHPPFDRDEALQGLDGFSHLWLIFVFHDCLGAGWRPMVRPPRLGGRRKVGVFASRAPYRPNPIGISAVRYLGAERSSDGLTLHLAGVDLLDGTPVLDIKPYVPYADALPAARAGFAPDPPESGWAVTFSDAAQAQLAAVDPDDTRQLRTLITQVIQQDPRPGYMDRYPNRTEFAMCLYDLEIRWRLGDRTARVDAIVPASRV